MTRVRLSSPSQRTSRTTLPSRIAFAIERVPQAGREPGFIIDRSCWITRIQTGARVDPITLIPRNAKRLSTMSGKEAMKLRSEGFRQDLFPNLIAQGGLLFVVRRFGRGL